MSLRKFFQKQSLKEFILENNVLTEEQWQTVEDSVSTNNESEYMALSKMFGSNVTVSRAIADQAGVKFIPLRELPKITQDIIQSVPRQMIMEYKIFPFGFTDSDKSGIDIACVDPTDSSIVENLKLRTSKEIVVHHASYDDIDSMISKYYGSAAAREAAEQYTQSYADNMVGSRLTAAATEINPDSPIITVVNTIIDQAARMKASDIHIEPFESFLRIRYRIDGALVEQPSYSTQMHSAIIARLKVMGGMDISEKRIPQDGRITFMVDNVEYDIRVSMLPTVYGEKCVMRLALRANLQRDKKDLGLTPYDLKIFDKIFSNPNGIILVTGPTGSGKSTTLYTALSELSTEEVNIVTVEDPVEANVEGVNQVHTNARAGLTFASALRSILRQDPDIIMIGEIRDQETAEIAVQAAITGHLVVSTLHTNSSSATVTRLVNMGLEPYLVADSVVGILAQRLVRRLCQRCKKQKVATPDELRELGIGEEKIKSGIELPIYEKGGCSYCNNTGYQGRIAVYEIMDVGPEIKAMIMANASTAEIKRVAVENGMHTLRRSAAQLVVRGVTTISEMHKVSSES